MEELTLDELKNQAKELGIKYSPNIGAEALQKKIHQTSSMNMLGKVSGGSKN